MRIDRRLARAMRAFVTTPLATGTAVVIGLTVWTERRPASSDDDLVVPRPIEVARGLVSPDPVAEIVRAKLGLVAAAVGLGVLVGLAAELVVAARRCSRGAARRRRVASFLEVALVCLAIHGALVLWAMADRPQLFAARAYAEGGLARVIQVLATDSLGPRGVGLVSIAVALVYVRPRRLVVALLRARRWVERRLRGRLTVPAILGAATLILALGIAAAARGSTGIVRVTADVGLPADAVGASLEPDLSRSRGGVVLEPDLPPPGAAGASAWPARRAPNILLFAASSLRADRLDPRLMPNLCHLAGRGARFDRAYVSIPRSVPSWVTILTGRHAHHHGIRSSFPTWEERARDFDALPARFARAGYETVVLTDRAERDDLFARIPLGFSQIGAPSSSLEELTQAGTLAHETPTPLLPLVSLLTTPLGRRAFPALRAQGGASDPVLLAEDAGAEIHALRTAPFFLAVFFSASRAPYAVPAPYYAKYTEPAYRGPFKYRARVGDAVGDGAPPDASDVTQVRALYDGAVNAVDDAVARVLASLEREGLAEDTIVVFVSDHGEALFEEDRGQGHGDLLFGDEGTHVPLVVYDPRIAVAGSALRGLRRDDLVRDVDLAPTLYELAGVPMPRDLDGRSLVPALRGQALEARPAFAETELWSAEEIPGLPAELRVPYPVGAALTEPDRLHGGELVLRRELRAVTLMARHRMLRERRWKLVYVPTRMGVKYMLFDTIDDPGEVRDVAAERAEIVADLRPKLWAWMLQDPEMEQRNGFLVPRVSEVSGRERAARRP